MEENERRMRDLRYISDPNTWVMLVCPIKRWINDKMELAYMVGDGPVIYYGNIHNPNSSDRKEVYANFGAIVDAGWMVD